EEISGKRTQPIIAELELEDVLIKRHHLRDALEMHHHMAHAERAGAEAGNVATRPERFRTGLRTVKDFEPIAGGVFECDQIRNMALVGECLRSARDWNPVVLELGGKRVEGRCVRNLPAEETNAPAAVCIDDEPLLPVVHAEGETRAAL